jgi:hypothetical protein
MDYVEIQGLGNKLDYYEVVCELVHYGSDLLDYVETFVQGNLEVLKDTGVKGMSYDTRNAKVGAPKGYPKDKLIPRVYISAMDLGALRTIFIGKKKPFKFSLF